jgi:tRNA pseudouridine38-40 synthase
MRVKIAISYDGSMFNGFQIQNNGQKVITIAGVITKELKKLNIKTILVGSGRTDTGVHATSQVIHFEIPEFWKNIEKLKDELNRLIKPYIYIKKIELVDKNFHARFSAKKRLYRYVLYSGEYQPFLSRYALHVNNIDIKKLDLAIKNFIGIHDFKNFKKQGSETSSNIRRVFKAGVYKYKNMTIIYFLGDSFLRSQVRMMCSSALEVMNDKLTSTQLKEQLSKNKQHSTTVIPATGLYLAKVFY